MTYFPGISAVKYEGPTSRNPLAFKYYNAEEVILGKPMKEWFRFAVAWWHTWTGMGADPFGSATREFPWDKEGGSPVEIAKRRVLVNFEFMEKLGVDYFCWHDRDVAPEGATLEESNKILDEVVAVIKSEMKRTGKKCLWGTANLFSNKRFMCGASTNPDPHVWAYGAAQVKKAMEITKELGGENYVLWGGREGYQTILNTDLKSELDHFATFLKAVRDYKQKIGFTGQLLIEPKPREPTSHQYDYDAATVIGFLTQHGLHNDFKLNLEANHATLAGHTGEHEVEMAVTNKMLGSIDANHNEAMLGWDTDMFPTDVKMATMIMRAVVRQGGLAPGGFNFDAKLRRESVDVEDLFIGHIGGMDTYAKALRAYAELAKDGIWEKLIADRYAGYKVAGSIGAKIEAGTVTLEEAAEFIAAHPQDPTPKSGKEEVFNGLLNVYC